MGALRFNIYQTVSAADEAALARLAADVSKSYFRADIPVAVRWGIPSASEADEPRLDVGNLSPTLQKSLEAAIYSFHRGEYENARVLLLPFVELKHLEASKLYVKTLQKLRSPDWDVVAKRINRVSTDSLFVPAGSTEVRDGEKVILVHQGLSASLGHSAPSCVVRYVVNHEFLHIHLQTDAEDPHPPLFRRFDKCFPQRTRSIKWLQAHGFTTIDDDPL